MLISLSADKESFREINFKPGLNIILAERTKDSTGKDSRNGLGKTSMIEIIHFLLGGNITNTLKKPQLENWTFILKLRLNDKDYSVSRHVTQRSKIVIEGDFTDWPIKPDKDSEGRSIISNDDWKRILGKFVFGIRNESLEYKYAPTFRSCISYFARLEESGGFLKPEKNYSSQKEWDIQVNNSFLLGLDWTYASKWQILKDRKKILSQLKTESESGLLRDMHGSLGELEAERIALEGSVNELKEQLAKFKVHPQYKKIESDSNKITELIHENVNDNISDKSLLNHYEKSLKEEKEPESEYIDKIYKEAGIVIPELVKKRLKEVKEFHKTVVENRRDFLSSEILSIKNNINRRENEVQILSEKRSNLFEILNKHRALDEHIALQNRNAEMVSQLENIKRKIENMKKFEEGKSALNIDLELIQQKARLALDERKKLKEKAVVLFNTNSQNLYSSPGSLSIDVEKAGYKFRVDIKRDGSHGIEKMKIFCYDLMKTQLLSEDRIGPNFLIHDSVLFADVDERQIAHAIELGRKEAEDKGFQYICTFNSDNIPEKDFSEGFDFYKFIRLKLTDGSPEGGLFGIRF